MYIVISIDASQNSIDYQSYRNWNNEKQNISK